MSGALGVLEALMGQAGYLGVFAVSLLGSVIPFVPLPYLLVVVLLSGTYNPLVLGVVAGAGGAVGKLTSYFLGRFGYLASGEETKGNLDALRGILTKYGALGVFIFAVTPLPDDVYLVPMGVIRLPFWRFFAADLAGKLVLSVAVAYLGRAYMSAVDSLAGASMAATVASAALTLAVTILVMRADWVLAVGIARKEGARGVVARSREILRLGKGGKARKD